MVINMSDLPDFAIPPERKSNSDGKRLPSEQNSSIPQGWKPTMAKPIPAVQCTGTVRSGPRMGERCDRWSTIGSEKCVVHGAQLPNVKKAAEARKDAARLKLLNITEDAADMVEYLMNYSSQDQIKLKAALEVLDRAGIKGGADITVDHQLTLAPSKMLEDKIAEMANRLQKEKEKDFTEPAELDIIESEVVADEETDTETSE